MCLKTGLYGTSQQMFTPSKYTLGVVLSRDATALSRDATALKAVTADHHTPLLLAVKAGKTSTFTSLIEKGASLDDKNATKQNAVHIAAEFNDRMLCVSYM